MELAAESGGAVPIDSSSPAVRGRSLRLSSGSAPYAADLTVSRRHLSLCFLDEDEPRIFFEVLGRNPICILSNGIGEKKLYKNGEKGELKSGDKLSLSIEKPFFFTVGKLRQAEDNADVDDHEDVVSGLETELDVARIDPVKEFGFLLKGHEFDHYPKNKIRSVKEWNWFLDEPSEASDEEEEVDDKTVNRKRRGRKKKRSTGEGEEEWTGESEEEKETVLSSRGAMKQYATRSRDVKKPRRDSSSKHKKRMEHDFDEEDDSDETVGGFIVNDEGEEELDEEEDEEEDEDEYDDDE